MTICVSDLLFRFRVAPSSLAEEYDSSAFMQNLGKCGFSEYYVVKILWRNGMKSQLTILTSQG